MREEVLFRSLEKNMQKTLRICIIYMGMVGASLALANELQECRAHCNEIQKNCEDMCRQQLKKADHKHCPAGCKRSVDACKKECDKRKP